MKFLTALAVSGVAVAGVLAFTSSGPNTAVIEEWIDGDTVHTSEGRVRLIGIDTPEMKDECRGEKAKEAAEALAPPGTEIYLVNPDSVDDTDRYDRLLLYVDVPSDEDSTDVGYSLIAQDLADARYDSTDGYDPHPREEAYHAADGQRNEDIVCDINDRNSNWANEERERREREEERRREHISDATEAGERRGREAGTNGSDRLPQYGMEDDWGKEARTAFTNAYNAAYDAAAVEWQASEVERAREDGKLTGNHDARFGFDYDDRKPDWLTPGIAGAEEAYSAGYATGWSEGLSNPASGSGGGVGDLSGYTGPRCYAPGGETWTPCP